MFPQGAGRSNGGNWAQANYSSHHAENADFVNQVYSNEALESALMAMMLDRVYGRLRGDGVAGERGGLRAGRTPGAGRSQ